MHTTGRAPLIRMIASALSAAIAVAVGMLPAVALADEQTLTTQTPTVETSVLDGLVAVTDGSSSSTQAPSTQITGSDTTAVVGTADGSLTDPTGQTSGVVSGSAGGDIDALIGQLLDAIGSGAGDDDAGDSGDTAGHDTTSGPGTDDTEQASQPSPPGSSAGGPATTRDPVEAVTSNDADETPASRVSHDALADVASASAATPAQAVGVPNVGEGRLGGHLEDAVATPAPGVDPELPTYLFSDISLARRVPPAGPRSTTQVLLDLQALRAPISVIVSILRPFPVVGPASYSDDWHAPRMVPEAHVHEGVDVFAPVGAPVIAVADGTVTRVWYDSRIGGNAVKLTAADGTYYYYAHLDRIFEAVTEGQRVAQGQLLGYVGATGNAVGTPPHLHFEIHPLGGAAVPPVPVLDRWLEQARQRVAEYQRSQGAIAPPVVAPAAPARSATGIGVASTAPGAAQSSGVAGDPVSQPASSRRAGSGALIAFVVIGLLALRSMSWGAADTEPRAPARTKVDPLDAPLPPLVTWGATDSSDKVLVPSR